MRATLWAALALTGALLGGCWVSETPLLDPRDAVHPVAAGPQVSTSDGRDRAIEARIQPDGWYRMVEDDSVTEVLFTPLTTEGAPTVFAFMVKEEDAYIYGIAERRDGEVLLDLPSCQPGPGLTIALAHRAAPPDPGAIGAACAFHAQADLRAALIDYTRSLDVTRDYMTLKAAP